MVRLQVCIPFIHPVRAGASSRTRVYPHKRQAYLNQNQLLLFGDHGRNPGSALVWVGWLVDLNGYEEAQHGS